MVSKVSFSGMGCIHLFSNNNQTKAENWRGTMSFASNGIKSAFLSPRSTKYSFRFPDYTLTYVVPKHLEGSLPMTIIYLDTRSKTQFGASLELKFGYFELH